MKPCALPSSKTESTLSVSELEQCAQGWLLSCEISRHSDATLANRRLIIRNLLWFLKRRSFDGCGVNELRLFFGYFNTGHKDPGGRWDNPQQTKPVKPGTVATYHRHITALFNWIIAEGDLPASPMARIPSPVDRPDQIEPFTMPQVELLLTAAKRSQNAKRDEALILFLLDTGIRASELRGLRFKDIEMSARKATVEGKGGKSRSVYFCPTVGKALWNYLKLDGRELEDAVFQSENGGALTASGLRMLLLRLAKSAKMTTARVSPHTFRHTFAVTFLRNGGNQMSLMQQLGHCDLKMTARYVKLAEADVEKQHQQFSPVESLKGKKR